MLFYIHISTVGLVLWFAAPITGARIEEFADANVQDEAFEEAERHVRAKRNAEQRHFEMASAVRLDPNSISRAFYVARDTPRRFSMEYHFEEITRILAKRLALTHETVHALNDLPLKGRRVKREAEICQEDLKINCSQYVNSKYRTPTGVCNNINNPTWGQAPGCFQRFLEADYADGISIPRRSKDGSALPSAEIVSTIIHREVDVTTCGLTHLQMQYGQILDHDMNLSPTAQPANGPPLPCCPISNNSNPECFPIEIPADNPFYSQFNQTCMTVIRTIPCPTCKLGARDQTDAETSFIDASVIYGSDNDKYNLLKDNVTGFLRSSLSNSGRQLLYQSPTPLTDGCSNPNKSQICFVSGDRRVNVLPTLTALHLLFHREHNRAAKIMRKINPHWDGHTVFEEARRFVGAQMQVITYKEYLPILLGKELYREHKLALPLRGQTEYDPTVNPTIRNEFGASAFRFGHSTVQGTFLVLCPNGTVQWFRLRDFYFYPFDLYDDIFDCYILGMTAEHAQTMDEFVTEDLTRWLFRRRSAKFGQDLAAINNQRGRDHGVRPYVDYRKMCFGDNIQTFNDLTKYMTPAVVERLRKVYKYVEDIDFYAAGLAEYSLPGAVIGPTFGCLIAQQFHWLFRGDRYFFSHKNQAGSFTKEQYNELLKTSMTALICNNGDNITEVQLNAFLKASSSNPVVKCKSVPRPNLNKWKE